MPITATASNPTTTGTVFAPTVVSQQEVPTRVVKDNVPLVTKPRAFVITAGQKTHLSFVFQDDKGNPFDLTGFTASRFSVELVEAAAKNATITPEVTISDATSGMLSINITKLQAVAGVYNGRVYCHAEEDHEAILRDNPFILYIEAGIKKSSTLGPPSIMEVRLQLRDSAPEENDLLDGLNFTDEEIALAVYRPVLYYNDSLPRTSTVYTTANFPWRYYWIEGVIAQLYRIAAEWHRKNNLQYSAGGVSVNDKNKESNYIQVSELHWKTFTDFVLAQKVKENMHTGWGVINSWYRR